MHPAVGAFRATTYTIGMSALAMTRVAFGADPKIVAPMVQDWARGLGLRLKIDVQTHGVNGVDWSKPMVLMANHQSYLDIFALYRGLPHIFGMVAKKELFKIPFFRGVMENIGCVAIDRTERQAAHKSLQNAAEKIRNGSSIVVFPEGTRSAGDRILPMKAGAFHLAQTAKVPVLPIGIRGSALLMAKDKLEVRSGTIEVHVGRPIEVAATGARGRNQLLAKVRLAIGELAGVPLAEDEEKSTEGRSLSLDESSASA